MKFFRFLICISLAVLSACNNNKKSNDNKQYLQKLSKEKEEAAAFYATKYQAYKLDDLRDSLKKYQLRLFISQPTGDVDTAQIITLAETDFGWETSVKNFMFGTPVDKRTTSVNTNATSEKPSVSWESFFKKLEATGVYTLGSAVVKSSDSLYGTETIRLEIVKDGKYSNYSIVNWNAVQDKSQLVKIEKLIQLFQDGFGFELHPLHSNSTTNTTTI